MNVWSGETGRPELRRFEWRLWAERQPALQKPDTRQHQCPERMVQDVLASHLDRPQLEGPEPEKPYLVGVAPGPAGKQVVVHEFFRDALESLFLGLALLDQVIVEYRLRQTVPVLHHPGHALVERRVLGDEGIATSCAQFGRQLVNETADISRHFTFGDGLICFGQTFRDRRELTSFDERPDRHATVGVIERLQFRLQLPDHVRVGSVGSNLCLDLDRTLQVLLVLSDLHQLGGIFET